MEPIECGYGTSCASYITFKRELINASSSLIGTFNVIAGYNIIWLEELIRLKSGSILLLTQDSAKLALYEDDNLIYGDYFLVQDNIYPLNVAIKTAVHFKVNIDYLYIKNQFYFIKKFPNIGIYNSQLVIKDSSLIANSTILINDGNFFIQKINLFKKF